MSPRKERDYRREYAQRKAKAAREGRTTRQARGHGKTPNRPIDAYRRPDRYPEYVARHFRQLNKIARDRGEPEVGIGLRGEEGEIEAERRVIEGEEPQPDWTYVVTHNPETEGEMRFGYAYPTYENAQEGARISGASPGACLIWYNAETGMWELFFRDYKGVKKRPRKWTQEELHEYNVQKREQVMEDEGLET